MCQDSKIVEKNVERCKFSKKYQRENEEENTKAIKIQRQTITYSDIRSISDIRDPDIDNSHISEFECKIDTDDKIVPELGPS